MTMLQTFLAGFLLAAFCPLAAAADTNTYFARINDWAYHGLYESYLYHLRHADISKAELRIQCHRAYRCYFEYWLLHRSSRSTLSPLAPFESHFGKLIRREVLTSVDRDDPLGIRGGYTDGRLRDNVVTLLPPTLSYDDLRTWAGYQELVGRFKLFVGQPEQRKSK